MSAVNTTLTPPPSIGVVICSSRQPRVCPQIAAFVLDTVKKSSSFSSTAASTTDSNSQPPASFTLIDLAEWNLPFFDEPNIPSQIKSHTEYTHAHTQSWSIEVQKHSAFIFVLPQYNWGYPAVIKNAIDYLFHEWHGKPAMIVSYGGHGGTQAAGQLRQVVQGVGMKVVETMPALAFPSRKELAHAAKGEDLGLLGEGGIWDAERKDICKAFEESMALVA